MARGVKAKWLTQIGLKQCLAHGICIHYMLYMGVDKSLARPTSRCILFDVKNISFDANLVIYINSTNIPPIMT